MNEFENEIQAKITADAEFQATLTGTDEEKSVLIEAKLAELRDAGLKELRENAGKLSKAEQIAEDQRKRAEKAEGEVKKYKPTDTKPNGDDKQLSTKDFYALTNAKVPEDDVDEVVEVAKFKNITVAEALKLPMVKAILADKAEVRKTASATQTRQTRSQNTAPDGDSIIQDARSKGESAIPEAGSKEADAMFWARRGRKPM